MLRGKGLVEWPALRPQAERRSVYVLPEILTKVRAPDHEPMFPRASAESLVGIFRSGGLVRVSRQMDVEADLKCMVGVDEIWVLCFRTPRPGGRLLGRFIERDLFVGLGLYTREELAGAAYTQRGKDAVAEYERLLPHSPTVRSADLKDYLSPHFKDLDNDDD